MGGGVKEEEERELTRSLRRRFSTTRRSFSCILRHSGPCLQVFREVCTKFRPVFRHFFYERFGGGGGDASEWYERRRAYTRSAAVNSMVRSFLPPLVGKGI